VQHPDANEGGREEEENRLRGSSGFPDGCTTEKPLSRHARLAGYPHSLDRRDSRKQWSADGAEKFRAVPGPA